MTAQQTIDRLLEKTHWRVSKRDNLSCKIALLDCTLELSSPDMQCLMLRADIAKFSANEEEHLNLSKRFAYLNASFAKNAVSRVVIENETWILEQVISPSELSSLNIEECVENFLNNYDYIKSQMHEDKQNSMPFDLTMLL